MIYPTTVFFFLVWATTCSGAVIVENDMEKADLPTKANTSIREQSKQAGRIAVGLEEDQEHQLDSSQYLTMGERLATAGHFETVGRNLQTANYRANYVGRFQYLLDSFCSGPYPVLQAFCKGSIEVLATSDPSISCEPLPFGTQEGFQGAVQCTNSCTDNAACSNIWLESGSITGGAFGSIFFQCEGDDPTDVDGAFAYEDSGDGSCTVGTFFDDGRNFHVAQMGIFCSDPTLVTGGEYNYGDFYFECGSDNVSELFDLGFSCYHGRKCKGSACIVEYDRVVVSVDVDRLDCIQSLDGTPVPPIPAPEIPERLSGEYKARFQANWQLDTDSSCTGKFPTIVVQCTNGDISIADTVFDTTSCTMVGNNKIECIESESAAFVNRYSGVVVDCTAQGEVPNAMVEYPSYSTTCSSSGDRDSAHKVQLGVFCGNAIAGGSFFYGDYYYECDMGVGYDFEDGRYTCRNGVRSPGRDSTPIPIPAVTMSTDFRWGTFAYHTCYSFVAGPPPDQTFCFSSKMTVDVEGKGVMAIDKLRIGDKVKNAVGVYDRVYSFGHRSGSIISDFLQLLPSKLELTADHMVLLDNGKAVPAAAIIVGDKLFHGKVVTGIRQVQRKGVYAPFTSSGTIAVNGVAASSYVAFQGTSDLMIGRYSTGISYQWIAHTFEAPHRLWCNNISPCKNESYTIKGISTWVDIPHQLVVWLIKQEWWVLLVAMAPALAILGIISSVESIMVYPSFVAGSILALLVLLALQKSVTIQTSMTKK